MKEKCLNGNRFDEKELTEELYRVIERLNSQEEDDNRIWALIELGEGGDPRAVKPIIDCSYDKNEKIRRYAIESLFRLRSVRGVSALSDRLKDRSEDQETRRMAARALGEIGTFSALEVLIQIVVDHGEDPLNRMFAAEALARAKTKRFHQVLLGCFRKDNLKANCELKSTEC